MKKVMSIVFAAVAGVALAENSTLESANTYAALRVDSSAVETIVCVPWLSASASGDTAIKITDVVRTAELNAGDKLYYYDRESGKYNVWVLKSNKEWEAATTVSDSSLFVTTSNEPSLTRGNAFILVRENPADAFYLFGQVPSSASPVMTMIRSSSAPVLTLFAPPSTSDTTINSGTWSNVNDGDMLIVDGKAPYTYVSGTGWCHKKITEGKTGWEYQFNDTTDTIPAGQGAWFRAAKADGGNATWSL